MTGEHDTKAIVSTIAGLGAALNKTVVAEGIETKEQMQLVGALGCHEGQGYYFARPMNGDAIRECLHAPDTAAQRVA